VPGVDLALIKRHEETPMRIAPAVTFAAAAVLLAGCQSTQEQVDSLQPEAIHTAQRRAAFELNCPTTNAQVLSRDMIQSPVMNPRFAPPQRIEYTVGVDGCGQRATYLVICTEGGYGCFAGGSRNVIR
jgi:hypothetical protein